MDIVSTYSDPYKPARLTLAKLKLPSFPTTRQNTLLEFSFLPAQHSNLYHAARANLLATSRALSALRALKDMRAPMTEKYLYRDWSAALKRILRMDKIQSRPFARITVSGREPI
jgi:hypothetical protein